MAEQKKSAPEKKIVICLFFALYTVALMFFCAGSSPFIDFMSTDSSVFFAMGRGMAHGKTVYTDMFDHKGWYVYFINCLGALISDSTSIGIFLVESCFIIFDAVLFYHIAKEFIKNQYSCIVASLLMVLLSLNYFTYQGGNLTEVYALTFQELSLLLVIKYFNSQELCHPPLMMLVHGICVGIVFELRANMIIMWGAVAIIIIIRLLYQHAYKNALLNILAGIIGIAIGLLPPIVYGVVTKSLDDMIEQSILFNMSYSGERSAISNIIGTFGNWLGLTTLVACMISGVVTLYSKNLSKWAKSMYAMALFLSIVGVSLSGRSYGHYFEYFIPLYAPLLIFLFKFLDKKPITNKSVQILAIVAVFSASICLNMRTPIRLFTKPTSWYYTHAVNSIADNYHRYNIGDKVLVTGNNAMIYNKMGIIPQIKYYYIPSISYEKYPYPIDSQISSILSGENDAIVICYSNHQNYLDQKIYNIDQKDEEIVSFVSENYDLVHDENDMQLWIKKKTA